MSEPKAIAERAEEVIQGLWHWCVWDDRIQQETHAYALADADGTVLVDPLPLAPAACRVLEPIGAICLTAACHQRSAWRFRRAYSAKVYAPAEARELEEQPDVAYRDGDLLPGALKAVLTPGPEQAHYAFWRVRKPSILFCADLVMQVENGALEFIPAEYHEDPAATRASVRRLLELPFEVLCLDHGAPVTVGAHTALRHVFA
jgi:glyoxylase-like metal-dependent hydrolase (beta-lactamase superfamily II)